MARFFFSTNYSRVLERVENHIFESTQSLDSVSRFLDEHDRALEFVARNPNASPVHPEAGDQTWLFSEGRYRIFFKIVGGEEDLLIFLTHLIDNREANLPIYPGNKMPTFSESNED